MTMFCKGCDGTGRRVDPSDSTQLMSCPDCAEEREEKFQLWMKKIREQESSNMPAQKSGFTKTVTVIK